MCPFSWRPAAQTRNVLANITGRVATPIKLHELEWTHVHRKRSQDHVPSEKVGLLHDAQKLLLIYLAIAIAVCLIDHLLELLVCHSLAEFLRNSLQILERDLPSLVVIEEPERLQNFVLRVAVQNLVRHHLQKLLVLDRAAAIVVNVRDHLLDLLLLGLETERTHGDLELLRVDVAAAVGVEEVEGLLDL